MFKVADVWWGGRGSYGLIEAARTVVSIEETLASHVRDLCGNGSREVFFRDDEKIPEPVFAKLREIIHEARRGGIGNLPILFLCRAGQERSMASAALAVSLIYGVPFDAAVARCKEERPDGMRHEVFQSSFADLARRFEEGR